MKRKNYKSYFIIIILFFIVFSLGFVDTQITSTYAANAINTPAESNNNNNGGGGSPFGFIGDLFNWLTGGGTSKANDKKPSGSGSGSSSSSSSSSGKNFWDKLVDTVVDTVQTIAANTGYDGLARLGLTAAEDHYAKDSDFYRETEKLKDKMYFGKASDFLIGGIPKTITYEGVPDMTKEELAKAIEDKYKKNPNDPDIAAAYNKMKSDPGYLDRVSTTDFDFIDKVSFVATLETGEDGIVRQVLPKGIEPGQYKAIEIDGKDVPPDKQVYGKIEGGGGKQDTSITINDTPPDNYSYVTPAPSLTSSPYVTPAPSLTSSPYITPAPRITPAPKPTATPKPTPTPVPQKIAINVYGKLRKLGSTEDLYSSSESVYEGTSKEVTARSNVSKSPFAECKYVGYIVSDTQINNFSSVQNTANKVSVTANKQKYVYFIYDAYYDLEIQYKDVNNKKIKDTVTTRVKDSTLKVSDYIPEKINEDYEFKNRSDSKSRTSDFGPVAESNIKNSKVTLVVVYNQKASYKVKGVLKEFGTPSVVYEESGSKVSGETVTLSKRDKLDNSNRKDIDKRYVGYAVSNTEVTDLSKLKVVSTDSSVPLTLDSKQKYIYFIYETYYLFEARYQDSKGTTLKASDTLWTNSSTVDVSKMIPSVINKTNGNNTIKNDWHFEKRNDNKKLTDTFGPINSATLNSAPIVLVSNYNYSLTIKYVDIDDSNVSVANDKVIVHNVINDSQSMSDTPSSINLNGAVYRYDHRSDNLGQKDTIKNLNGDTTIIVYYKKTYSVTVRYIDKLTGNELNAPREFICRKGLSLSPIWFVIDGASLQYYNGNISIDYAFEENATKLEQKNGTSSSSDIISFNDLDNPFVVDGNVTLTFYYSPLSEYVVRLWAFNRERKSLSMVTSKEYSGTFKASKTVTAPAKGTEVPGDYIGHRKIDNLADIPASAIIDISKIDTIFSNPASQVTFTLDYDHPKVYIDFLYETKDGDTAPVVDSTVNSNKESAIAKLRSNPVNGGAGEEYDVNKAVPTSEDLYAQIDAGEFILNSSGFKIYESEGTCKYTYVATCTPKAPSIKLQTDGDGHSYWEVEYDSNGNVITGNGTKVTFIRTKSNLEKFHYIVPVGASIHVLNDGNVSNSSLRNGTKNNVSLTSSSFSSNKVVLDFSDTTIGINSSARRGGDTYDSYAAIKTALANGSIEAKLNDGYNNVVNNSSVRMGSLSVINNNAGYNYSILNGTKSLKDTNASDYESKLKGMVKSFKNIPIAAKPMKEDKNLYVKLVSNGKYNTKSYVDYKFKKSYGDIVKPGDVIKIDCADDGKQYLNVLTPVVNYSYVESSDSSQLASGERKNVVVLGEDFTLYVPHFGVHSAYSNTNDTYNYGGIKSDINKPNPEKDHFANKREVIFPFTVISGDGPSAVTYNSGEVIPLGISNEEFIFSIPLAEQEAWNNVVPIVTTRVYAENYDGEYDESKANKNYNAQPTQYIAIYDNPVKIVGSISGLRIRASDDPGWKELNDAVLAKSSPANSVNEFPLGRSGQNKNSGYKYALKLGYSAFYDMKIAGNNGETTTSVEIKPRYYYIKKDGSKYQEVDLYYNTGDRMYVKLDDAPVAYNMILTNCYGNRFDNESKFEKELMEANKLNAASGVAYKYNAATSVGDSKLMKLGLNVRLPYENTSNLVGHWYGMLNIPVSTMVVPKGTSNVGPNTTFLKDGYIGIAFDSVIAKTGDTDYLSYGQGDPTWKDDKRVTLPNGKANVSIPGNIAVLYETDLKASDDFGTERPY